MTITFIRHCESLFNHYKEQNLNCNIEDCSLTKKGWNCYLYLYLTLFK